MGREVSTSCGRLELFRLMLFYGLIPARHTPFGKFLGHAYETEECEFYQDKISVSMFLADHIFKVPPKYGGSKHHTYRYAAGHVID